MKECTVDECVNRRHGHGLCMTHLDRLRKHGSLDLPPKPPWDPNVRFWPRVNKSGECWEWTASILKSGYGNLRVDGKLLRAHRVSYEMANGPIPEGLFLDHICRNRACVRPQHLRPVTPKQNSENRGNTSTSKLPKGVSPRGIRFRARVTHYGEWYYLGTFNTVEEAEAAVVAKRNELYTHNNLDWYAKEAA